MQTRRITAARAFLTIAASALAALAQPAMAWEPAKPIEFVATAGPGGGTDIFARTVQAIVTKHKLVSQPIVVLSKGGGSGAEGYLYVKSSPGDPYKLAFGTSNNWSQPMLSNVPWAATDFVPVAAMVQDEFMLWVKQDAPIQNVGDYLKAVAAAKGDWHMGGAQSKDTDEILTHLIETVGKVKITYIPFKSGGEAAVQLAGGHVGSHTNNPSESIGQWKAGTQRPLCVFNTQRLPAGPKVTATQSWSDIPTCKESGLDIALYQQPRAVYLPARVKPEEVAYYVQLMKKVQATPEWKEYLERTQQTSVFISGAAFDKLMTEDIDRTRRVGTEQGWIAR